MKFNIRAFSKPPDFFQITKNSSSEPVAAVESYTVFILEKKQQTTILTTQYTYVYCLAKIRIWYSKHSSLLYILCISSNKVEGRFEE